MRARTLVTLCALALLSLLSLAIATLAILAFSGGGVRQLARIVHAVEPRLEIAHESGNLFSPRFSAIRWRDEDLLIALTGIDWQLDAGCLLRDRLCFRELHIAELDINLGEGSGDDSPLALAPVLLPLSLDVASGSVAALLIRRGEETLTEFRKLQLTASMDGSLVDVKSLRGNLDTAEITVAGRIELRDQLPLEATGSVALGDDYTADVTAEGSLARLEVAATTGGTYKVAIDGELALLEAPLGMRLDVMSRAPIPVVAGGEELGILTQAKAALRGDLDNLQVQLEGDTSSPWTGGNRLELEGAWRGNSAEISALRLRGEAGEVSVSGRVAIGQSPSWDLLLNLNEFCPTAWQPRFRCALGGESRLSGSADDTGLRLAATALLNGTVGDYPAAIRADIRASPGNRWEIREFVATTGANTLHVAGHIDERLALEGDLRLNDLGDILAGTSGRGEGTIRISGTLDAPSGQASASLQDLAGGGNSVSSLTLDAAWFGLADARNRFTMRVEDARLGELAIPGLTARLEGSAPAHRLRLAATTPFLALDADCSGALPTLAAAWEGRCPMLKLRSASGETEWRLDHPMALSWQRAPTAVGIEPFCLRSATASICSRTPVRFEPGAFSGVELAAKAIPAEWLSPWTPAEVVLSGTFALEATAAGSRKDGLSLEASLVSDGILMETLAAGEEVPLTISDLTATITAKEKAARIRWQAAIGEGGGSSAEIALDDIGAANALSGRIELSRIDVTPFVVAAPSVLDAKGTLGGVITVGGNLSKPVLSGSLSLTDAHLSHELLPQPIDEIELEFVFDGLEAQVDGSFLTSVGRGRLRGSAEWLDEEWSAELRLDAEALQIEPMRGSEITVVPDIKLSLNPRRAIITGKIDVPRANIDLDRLPQTATSVSPDTVIVGSGETGNGFDYEMSIEIRLGEAVQFRGFGARAKLAGSVTLLKPPGDPLEGEGVIRIVSGRYRAYGQNLEVSDGKLIFNGPLGRPDIRVTAVRRIEDENVIAGVEVTGNVSAPKVSVFSRPAMDENRALYYLLTGRAPETDDEANMQLAVATAMMQAGIAGTSNITGNVMETLGIQDFQVDARQVEGGTEVQLSGYLSPDLYLRYGVSTFDNVNTLRVRYRLAAKLFVEVISGIEDAIDLLYSFER